MIHQSSGVIIPGHVLKAESIKCKKKQDPLDNGAYR